MVTSTRQTYGTQEHYIDGVFRASAAAETFESLNPATNEVLALAAAGEARTSIWRWPRRGAPLTRDRGRG